MNTTTTEPLAADIRRARAGQSDEVARLFRRTAGHAWDFLYPHTDAEDRDFFAGVLRDCTVWVAVHDERIVGFCAVRAGWIDHLYVAPEHQGRGLGQRLLARALSGRRRVRLWTFQRNTRSRAFYSRQGFAVVRMTDGQANEEREPDVLLEWRRDPGARSPAS